MTDNHSLLVPPSSASIFLHCHGSGHAQLHMPDLFSIPSEEGTGAHMHSNACFNLNVDAEYFIGADFNGFKVTEEQVEHVQGYLDMVRNTEGEYRYVEKRLELPEISEHLFGTVDSAIYSSRHRLLNTDDLKYGFDPVSIEANGQLWVYSLMLALFLKKNNLAVSKVKMGIYQPRAMTGETYESETIAVTQLIEWGEEVLKPAVIATIDPTSPRTAGKHCKYCKAKIACPEYLSWCNYIVEFPLPVTDEMVHQFLQWEKTTKPLIKDAKAYGTDRLHRGFAIDGCKMVKQIKHRQLDDKEETAKDLLASGATKEQVYKFEIRSPNQLKIKIDKTLHEIIEDHSYTPEGGKVIALMSDKRAAVSNSKEIFKNG